MAGITEPKGNIEKYQLCASVFYTFECSQMPGVAKTKHVFSMFYTLIKHGVLANQSARRFLSILL